MLKASLVPAAALLGGRWTAQPNLLSRIKLSDRHPGSSGDTLIVVFLRGGADGLNMIVPHGDDMYYELRPLLGIPRPDDNRAEGRVLDLDGFYGLHPSLAVLQEIYNEGDLAFVHAAGSQDESRSHFEAMDLMERGVPLAGDYSGWLARHLNTAGGDSASALRAVAVGDMLPTSLAGAVSATALQSIEEFHLQGRDGTREERLELLAALYEDVGGMLAAAAAQTLESIEVIRNIREAGDQPVGRAYPEGDFGEAMRTVARLIKADVGLEAACVDLIGWDTHAAQGSIQGTMARLMDRLAGGVAAFYEDVQARIDGITVVVMSEFGRRAKENAALGTDHGHGNMMMVLGGGICGGRVYTDWPGLGPEQLVGSGDLAVTTDYRDVLGEVIRKRLNNPLVEEVFPAYQVSEVGLAEEKN